MDPLILRIEGPEWDLERLERFEAQIEPAYHHPNVVMDLSEVQYVDSSILAAFARKRKYRKAQGWAPSRLVLTKAVHRVFNTVGFSEVWPIFDSLDAALAS